MLWLGLGCGGLLLLSLGGGIAAYFYMQSQVSAVESAVAAASAAAAGETPAAPSNLSPTCAKAIACCKATMAKTAGSNAATAEQACNGIGLLADDVCVKQYEGQKRAATVVGASCP